MRRGWVTYVSGGRVGLALTTLVAATGFLGAFTPPQAPAAQGTVTAHKKYGYPYPKAPDCPEFGSSNIGCVVDKWRFYKGQCTSWTAYRLNQRSKVPFHNYYKGVHWGNASNWGAAAGQAGVRVDSKPAVGAVAWYADGHVGYVEQVSPHVVISEMNYDLHNGFRVTAISPGSHWPSGFIHFKDLKKKRRPVDNNPNGNLDKAGSPDVGKVRVAGWAFDPNKKKSPVNIHAYLGGKVSEKGVKGYSLGPAKKKRTDVAKAHDGVGSKHGYDKVFKTGVRGPTKVCVYAINRGPGSNKLLGCEDVVVKAIVNEKPCSTDDGDRPGTYWPDGTWHLRNELSTGPSDYIFKRGRSDRIPVVGDWNGDGQDSTGLFFPSDGTWHLRNELSAGPSDYIFKRAKKGREDEVVPVVGDWDGDGRDSTGAYFPWDGTWHLRNELSAGPSDYIFKRGRSDKIPLVGDWDGDGRDSTGTYWPWDGTWHLRNDLSSGPSDCIFKRGRSDKIPVVGNWDGEPPPPPPPPVDEQPEEAVPVQPVAPRIGGMALSKRAIRINGTTRQRRTILTFRLSRRARVRIIVARLNAGVRRRGRCVAPAQTRRRAARPCNLRMVKLIRVGRAGTNRVPLWSRMGRKRLRPGRYLVTVVARGGGQTSKHMRRVLRVRR